MKAFETLQLMSDLLEDPEAYTLHLKRYTASIGSTVVYGWRVPSMNLAPVNALYEVYQSLLQSILQCKKLIEVSVGRWAS